MARKLFFLICACLTLGFFLTVSWSKEDLHKMSMWHVNINPTKPKAKNEYDVIVAGGGFGGLSSAALLAKNGYKVLVVEKNPTVGGLCSSYEEHGYRFCYGAEDIDGLGENGSLTYLLTQLGMDLPSLFVPNTHTFLDGRHAVKVGVGKDAFENALIQIYPASAGEIRRFFKKAKKVYAEAYDAEMIQKWGIIVPQDLYSKAMSEAWIRSYPETHKNVIEWDNKPYQDVLDEYFSTPDIKTVLCGFVSYLGARPYNTPASVVVVQTFGYYFSGGYQALGTPQRFAEKLASYVKKNGGEVLCNHLVDKILVDSSGVHGVQVGKDAFMAPVVVCNVNAKTAYFDLINSDEIPPDFLKDLWSLPLGNSAFSLHLAVDDQLSSYPSVLQDRYNHTYIAIPTKNDPTLAPQGKSTVILRETVRFTNFIRNTKEETEEYIKSRTEDLLAKGQTLIPELAKGTVIKKVLTPDTYAHLANIPYGAIYGFDVQRSSDRPFFRAPISGLYMANASLGRAGVDGVITSGILCAHDIMGWSGK